MNIYTIYKATNKINNKCYIGFDSHWPKRKSEHKSAAMRDKSYNKFYNAIKKYGWDNFIWEIVYQSTDGNHCLNSMEPYFIKEFNSLSTGYNSSYGGESGLGNKWWNNGIVQVFTPIPPDDAFVRGRLPFNNRGAKIGSEIQKMKRWINNGEHQMMFHKNLELPSGYSLGRLPSNKLGKPNLNAKGTIWWNNGNISKMSKECPGPDFVPGRMKITNPNQHLQI
jgi:group I intron endonuclease